MKKYQKPPTFPESRKILHFFEKMLKIGFFQNIQLCIPTHIFNKIENVTSKERYRSKVHFDKVSRILEHKQKNPPYLKKYENGQKKAFFEVQYLPKFLSFFLKKFPEKRGFACRTFLPNFRSKFPIQNLGTEKNHQNRQFCRI